jgi:hypothetical protein
MTKREVVCSSLKLLRPQWSVVGKVLLLDLILELHVHHRALCILEFGF